MSNEKTIDDGGQAFPQISPSLFANPAAGMTKREYFAALAMQGLLLYSESEQYGPEQTAEYAVKHADALIAALKVKP